MLARACGAPRRLATRSGVRTSSWPFALRGVTQHRAFAVLAHTWRGDGDVGPPRQRQRVVVLMHGILGSQSNWNTPARKLLKMIGPMGWRILQLDHRAHGKSPPGSPPHTLDACARDVLETLSAVGVHVDQDEVVVCGHSFGGKVALAIARLRLEAGARPPKMTWLFDSVPGLPVAQGLEDDRKEQSVGYVLSVVEQAAAQGVFADRAALIDVLVGQYGLRPPLAQWVGQSVRNVPGGVAIAYDIDVVRALYDDYRGRDMWEVLEGGRADVGVVAAGRNLHAWGPQNLARLENSGARVTAVTLKDAGHNVHVDDLPGLLRTLERTFD